MAFNLGNALDAATKANLHSEMATLVLLEVVHKDMTRNIVKDAKVIRIIGGGKSQYIIIPSECDKNALAFPINDATAKK
jgi:hypothetical protein